VQPPSQLVCCSGPCTPVLDANRVARNHVRLSRLSCDCVHVPQTSCHATASQPAHTGSLPTAWLVAASSLSVEYRYFLSRCYTCFCTSLRGELDTTPPHPTWPCLLPKQQIRSQLITAELIRKRDGVLSVMAADLVVSFSAGLSCLTSDKCFSLVRSQKLSCLSLIIACVL